MLGLLFDAAVIGIIIAALQKDEFPGWGPMIGCALGIGLATGVAGYFLPGWSVLLAPLAGAAVGACLISWLCAMEFHRSLLAVGIYLAIGVAFQALLALML